MAFISLKNLERRAQTTEEAMAENFSLSPPLRFGMVNPGIYRGAYPVLPNFRFLYQLKLKTIISLTPEPPIEDLRLFGENAGINIIHFPISRTGPLSNELFAQLCQVVQLCVDSSNFPIYIHCLDGRRITSVFVLMLRKVQAWNPVSSFTEYWRYQVSFKSLQPMAEIEKTTKDLEKFLSESIEVSLGDNVPTWLYGRGERPTHIAGVKIKTTTSAPPSAASRDNLGTSQSTQSLTGLTLIPPNNSGGATNTAALSPTFPSLSSASAPPVAPAAAATTTTSSGSSANGSSGNSNNSNNTTSSSATALPPAAPLST